MNAPPRMVARGGMPMPRAAPRHAPGGPLGLLFGLIVWLMLCMMVVPGDLNYSAMEARHNVGDPVTRSFWLAFLGLSLLVMAMRSSQVIQLLRGTNRWYLAFVLLAVLSLAWSADSSVTIARIIRLLTMTIVSIAFATVAWNPRRFQNVVRWGMTLLLVGCIVFVIMSPELAVHQENQPELLGAWHGLATQKNGLGAVAAVAAVMWMQAWLARDVRAPSALIGLGVAWTCLVNSRSSTSLVSALIASLFLFTLLRTPAMLRRYMKWYVAALAIMVIGYTLEVLRIVPGIGLLLAPVSLLTGKDSNFTARADIWDLIEDHIKLHPLTGTGYGAYWVGPDPASDSFIFLQKMYGFYPGSSHNGYLDVTNDLGMLGLACLVGYLIYYLRDSLRLLMVDRPQGTLFLALFLQQAFANLSESHWFQVTSFNFVVMTLGTFCLARALVEARRGRQTPIVFQRRSASG
jgi:exopolysaccharide production protein ExoQ